MVVTFSEHLQRLMREKGIPTAAALAVATGISHVAIGNYIKGRIPKHEQLQKLADFFGVGPDYLLNPAKYSTPVVLALISADQSSGPQKQRQVISEPDMRHPSLLLEEEIDWQARALTAEGKLAILKKRLSDLASEN